MKKCVLTMIAAVWTTVSAASDLRCFCEVSAAVEAAVSESGLTKTTFDLSNSDTCAQLGLPQNAVTLSKSLSAALFSFGKDSSHIESPLAIALDQAIEALGVPYVDPVPDEVVLLATKTVQNWINDPRTRLTLVGLNETPEHGESPALNWIIQLKMPHVSDHTFWAIVDRAGIEPTYNYGFN